MAACELTALLKQRIQRDGPLPFVQFMDTALYQPGLGYYERASIGRRGDYYTSVSTGQVFAQLVAFQFAAWLKSLPDGVIHLVEGGAHDGRLAADILERLHLTDPCLWERLLYVILEPSPVRRDWQKQSLEKSAGRVRWLNEPADLGTKAVRGVIFSNELLDAFPLHLLGWNARDRYWFEWGVACGRDRFVWERLGAISSELSEELNLAGFEWSEALLRALPDGFTLEVCPAARRWWQTAAGSIDCGLIMTIDYGLTAEEFLLPHRSEGTLRAYHRHRMTSDLLARPGKQDLTAHVNFTALQHAGESAGLRTADLLTQTHLLTRIAARTWVSSSGSSWWTPERTRQFQTLTHPDHFGRAFKVFIQTTASDSFSIP